MKIQTGINTSNNGHYDLLIIGAGLSGLCLAYLLHLRHPSLNVHILEEKSEIPKDRTWSFHATDIEDLNLWKNFINYSWEKYQVHFSGEKIIDSTYHTMTSKSFFGEMNQLLENKISRGTRVTQVMNSKVITAQGGVFFAPIIIDSRPSTEFTLQDMQRLGWGFQKFYGQEIQLEKPHSLKYPILMDTSVSQEDGYRFMYILPFAPDLLLVEDTYYNTEPELDLSFSAIEIKNYCEQKNWSIKSIHRTEQGCLPIPTTSVLSYDSGPHHKLERSEMTSIFKIGMSGGFFHPVTGYSFGSAAKVAETLSNLPHIDSPSIQLALNKLRDEFKSRESYYLTLNRLLFQGAEARYRWKIFEFFYRLPLGTIERFYGQKMTLQDRIRLMIGKPPIPVHSALKVLLSKRQTHITLNRNNSI